LLSNIGLGLYKVNRRYTKQILIYAYIMLYPR
jgi:hypothetical protein